MPALTLSGFLVKSLRHGQNFFVYPGAFEDSDIRLEGCEPPSDLTYEELKLTTSDRVALQCYFLPAGQPKCCMKHCRSYTRASPRATVIMFHGNGYHIWHHIHAGKEFVRLGCNVLLVSYRGYGNSAGTPSEKGLRRDAQAALDYVLSQPELSQSRIVIHGHSLGGAVAIDLTSRNPSKISALIIENTFLSIPQVARGLPCFRHLTFFIHQRWDSASKIRLIERTTPILMLSGAMDMVVPPTHMAGLWEISRKRGDPSHSCDDADLEKDQFHVFPDGDHADTWIKDGYWAKIDLFLSLLATPPS